MSAPGYTRQEDIVIGLAGDRDLLADLYLPKASYGNTGAVVFVHGGGWRRGSKKGVRGFGEYLSEHGIAVLCPEYRLTPEALWPAQIEDVNCALRYLRANADELRIDSQRIGVAGDSAGGHLALMAAVTNAFQGSGGHNEYENDVKAVCAMYGPTTVRQPANESLMGPDAQAEDYDLASPLSYDLSGFPPCLLMHGSLDPSVPLAETTAFYEKLVATGHDPELHVFAGLGHAFDRQQPSGEKMVDVADPASIYGATVLNIIRLFFERSLQEIDT